MVGEARVSFDECLARAPRSTPTGSNDARELEPPLRVVLCQAIEAWLCVSKGFRCGKEERRFRQVVAIIMSYFLLYDTSAFFFFPRKLSVGARPLQLVFGDC